MATLTNSEISEIVNEALTIAMTSSGNFKINPYNGDINYKAFCSKYE
jgi:hypothetical protein